MISTSFYDHTVTIWGSRQTRGDDFGEPDRQWSPVFGQDGRKVALQSKSGSLQEVGPGERVVGEYMAYGPVDLDVCEGDIFEVWAGPQVPPNSEDSLLLKVDSQPYRPFGRHTEIVLVHWGGEL